MTDFNTAESIETPVVVKRKRGRPLGSKNRPKIAPVVVTPDETVDTGGTDPSLDETFPRI